MRETTDNRPVDRDLGLTDYWRMVWKRKWLIVLLCVLSVSITYVYAKRLPKIYTATVTALLPRMEPGLGGGISLPLGGGEKTGGGAGAGTGWGQQSLGISMSAPPPFQEAYLAYLKSRTMREEVIGHFKRSWGPSVVSLIGGTNAGADKDGMLSVTVESQDPRLSAEVANFYLVHLGEMLVRKTRKIRELSKQFYLSRLEPARQDFEEAQKALMVFQEKHRTLGLSTAAQAAISGGAAGAANVIGMEMQRSLKRMYLTDRHPEMVAMDRQIYEAKRLISHSLWGEAQELPPPPQESPNAPLRKEYFVAAAKLTPLQFKAADVLRTLQIRQGVYQTIATNIETSKYSEDAPPPYIEVIDPAIPPSGPSRPSIQSYVRAAALASLVVGIFLAFFLEYFERVKSRERLPVVEPRRTSPRFVPASDLADGPLGAELGNGPVSVREYAEELVTRLPEGRRTSAEPLAPTPEGRRFL